MNHYRCRWQTGISRRMISVRFATFFLIVGCVGGFSAFGADRPTSVVRARRAESNAVTYRRTPISIVDATSGKRIAESGNWTGIWHKPDGTMRKTGVYLAMWIPSGGTWRLKSEAFVTLACSGSSACDKAG
jgi:hypothetical protein